MSTGVARPSAEQYPAVLDQYAAAMKAFGQQKFDKAKPLLEKVAASEHRDLAERATLHLNACNLRLGSGPKPKAPEDYYQLGVVKLNAAQYDEAEVWLSKAGSGAHVKYALACLRAQTGNPDAALSLLGEAIQGDRQFRMLARQDKDFDPLMDDPRFTEILYPEY